MEAQAREREALAEQAAGKTALQHIIAAVELYMKAVAEAKTPAERNRLRRKCQELMAKGEQLKATATTATTVPSMSSLSLESDTATAVRELPKKEQIILLRASRLHGAVFPPWDVEPAEDVFGLPASGCLFEDDAVFSMSRQQRDVFLGWKRPDEIFPSDCDAQDPAGHRFMRTQEEPDLVQDITTDCSVVASMCAIVQHAARHPGGRSLLGQMIRPYDETQRRPRLSASGKYVFRMHFNGAFRRVVVDDRLPSSSSRTLFVVDRQNPALLWPALLEKAYLKVHGGYDFPGSNSGTDLWILTGWVPEQIFLQSNEEAPETVWERVQNAYDRGDVMLTLGTGQLSLEEEALLGLAGEHDYAVLDMQTDAEGNRRMLVKNPWCDNLVWRGHGTGLTVSAPPMTGTFWIGWDDIVQYYETLYLNWNPRLFPHCQHHHFHWTLPCKAMAHSLEDSPQYAVQLTADGPVWMLLNRHFQDADLDQARRKRRERGDDDDDGDGDEGGHGSSARTGPGFIGMYVFAAHGRRVALLDRPRWRQRAPLVDAPQTLLRLEGGRAGERYTVVAAQAQLPLPHYSFTLSLFAAAPLRVAVAGDGDVRMAHRQEVQGEWSLETAGGSAASPDFVRNPQYALVVPAATPLSLLLCAESDDVPLRVDLVWARGQRVAALAVRDLVVSSGEYRRGSCLAVVGDSRGGPGTGPGDSPGSASFGPGVVEPGTYTVVVSTFERGQHTRFVLRIASAVPVDLQPLPAEDAGRLRTTLPPLMLGFGEDAADATERTERTERTDPDPDAAVSDLRWHAVLASPAPPPSTRIRLIVQAVERRARTVCTATAAAAATASTTAVRVTLERLGSHSYETLAVTGDGLFQAMPVAGLRTPDVSMGRPPVTTASNGLPAFRIVVEARNGGGDRRQLANIGIRVDVLASDRLQVHPWEEA